MTTRTATTVVATASKLSLDASLPRTCSDEETARLQKCWKNSNSNANDDNLLVIAQVDKVQLSYFIGDDDNDTCQTSTQREDNNDQTCAAVFVPAILTEDAIESTGVVLPLKDSTPVIYVNNSTQEQQQQAQQLSNTLLGSIHSFLAHNFAIKGVLLVRNDYHYPADVVLLDLSHTPPSVLSDLLDTLNCQRIHAGPEAILKLLVISKVNFSNKSDRNNVGTNVANLSPPRVAASLSLQSQVQEQQRQYPIYYEIPSCPVCLHRIDPPRLGLPRPLVQQLCSKHCRPYFTSQSSSFSMHSNNNIISGSELCAQQRLLRPWPPPSHCVACQIIHTYWKKFDATASNTFDEELKCGDCAMQETLWVCLTCGYLGCGRYSNKHAAQHFVDTGHPFSLELATLRIWGYVMSEFVHRVDFLDCPSSPPRLYPWSAQTPSRSSSVFEPSSSLNNSTDVNGSRTSATIATMLDERSPKKATMITEEYEALLQSALEEQAQHYEGEIIRLRADLTARQIDQNTMTDAEMYEIDYLRKEIALLRSDIDVASRELLDTQAQEAGYRATSQRLLREQQVAADVLKKIQQETQVENQQKQQEIEDLTQQIADLTANQRMRRQFLHDQELVNAQIWGLGDTNEGRGNKKGKKPRKGFRR